jgi:hypothetical protein
VNRRFLLSYCSTVLLQYCINYLLPCFLASFHPFSHVLCYTLYAIHHPSSVICHVIRRSLYTVHCTPYTLHRTVHSTPYASQLPYALCRCAYVHTPHPAPNIQYSPLGIQYLVPSTQYSVVYILPLSPSTPLPPYFHLSPA